MILYFLPEESSGFFDDLVNRLENFENFSNLILDKTLPIIAYEEEDEGKVFLCKSDVNFQLVLKKMGFRIAAIKGLGKLALNFSEYDRLIDSIEFKEKRDAYENEESIKKVEAAFKNKLDAMMEEADEVS